MVTKLCLHMHAQSNYTPTEHSLSTTQTANQFLIITWVFRHQVQRGAMFDIPNRVHGHLGIQR